MKGAGFLHKSLFILFFFYHPPWFAGHWDRLLFSHKIVSCIPFKHLCLFRGYETWFFRPQMFHHTNHHWSHWKNLSMFSVLSCLLQNYGDLISSFVSSVTLRFTTMCLSEKHKEHLHVPKKLICSLLRPFEQWIKFWILLKWCSMYFPLFYSVNELFKKGMFNVMFKILSPI